MENLAKRIMIFLGAALFAFSTASAQSWAWAVYHNGDAILVANMSNPPDLRVWTPVSPCTHQSRTQAQSCACMLVTQGDLTNRIYTSVQIARNEWSCP